MQQVSPDSNITTVTKEDASLCFIKLLLVQRAFCTHMYPCVLPLPCLHYPPAQPSLPHHTACFDHLCAEHWRHWHGEGDSRGSERWGQEQRLISLKESASALNKISRLLAWVNRGWALDLQRVFTQESNFLTFILCKPHPGWRGKSGFHCQKTEVVRPLDSQSQYRPDSQDHWECLWRGRAAQRPLERWEKVGEGLHSLMQSLLSPDSQSLAWRVHHVDQGFQITS